MHIRIDRAGDRGQGEHGWLSTRFSFSFANWYDPRRMGFGALRVLNDDTILPGGKFGMHPHENFEIVTVPLKGAVTHEDNLGNLGAVHAGEVQAISAGRGVLHSEYNDSPTETLELFQIWIEPKVRNVVPRYTEAAFTPEARVGAWQVLASGDGVPGSVPLYQDARIARAELPAGTTLSYECAYRGNGMYALVIAGAVTVAGETLSQRDAIGITDAERAVFVADGDADVLVIEVPMRA